MQAITNLSVNALKVHPRNTEFFDDIKGEEYERFKDSIERNGIITPLQVAPDMTLISGHQRLKAATEIGLKSVPCIVMEDIEDEDKKLELLLVANFGREKNDEAKRRKIAVTYVELKGKPKGRPSKNCEFRSLKMEEIAAQLGTNERTLHELLAIERKLTPEFKKLLDAGEINKSVASQILVKLSKEDQNALLDDLGRDRLQEMTQKQVQEYVDNIKKEHETEVSKLKKQLDESASVVEAMANQVKAPDTEALIEAKLNAEANQRDLYEKSQRYKREAEQYKKTAEKYKSAIEAKDNEIAELKKTNFDIGDIDVEPKIIEVEVVPEDYEILKKRFDEIIKENREIEGKYDSLKRQVDERELKEKLAPKEKQKSFDITDSYNMFRNLVCGFENDISPFINATNSFKDIDEALRNKYVSVLNSLMANLNILQKNIDGGKEKWNQPKLSVL
jgi:ParB family chromosome partitioning protein